MTLKKYNYHIPNNWFIKDTEANGTTKMAWMGYSKP